MTPSDDMLAGIGLELFEEDMDDDDELVLEGTFCRIDNYCSKDVTELDLKYLLF